MSCRGVFNPGDLSLGVVGLSVVEPKLSEEGWRFGDYRGAAPDDVNGARFMHEIYPPRRSALHRARDCARAVGQIEAWNARICPSLNNRVYSAGFATTQDAYEAAFTGVFTMLDRIEAHLAGQDCLAGETLTEADIRLFVTLIRFDTAYHGLFKCNLRRIADYPAPSRYLRRTLAIPGIAVTVDIDHIKQGYSSIKAFNPNGIVPLGQDLGGIFCEQ